MKCTICGVTGDFSDNFCRRCGVEKRSSRLPVRREPDPLPVLWQKAAPVVARGAALVVAGVLGEWLLRSATKRAVSLPFHGRKSRKSRALARRDAPRPIVAISETVIMRRVVVKR